MRKETNYLPTLLQHDNGFRRILYNPHVADNPPESACVCI